LDPWTKAAGYTALTRRRPGLCKLPNVARSLC